MTKQHILNTLKTLYLYQLGSLPEFTLTTTHSMLEMDTLDEVEMLLAIEDEFDMAIVDEDWESCKTIGDIINLIESNI
jgi:acyl carrier protein